MSRGDPAPAEILDDYFRHRAAALTGSVPWRHEPPARLAVAVSGGSDSVALLHLLKERGGCALTVLTVDHGFRPEAAAEAAEVARIAARLGLPHRTLGWRWDGQGNAAEAARAGRYAALVRACAEAGIADCALGHTRDDNVETFFMGLMRGAGLDGLAGMRPAFRQGGVTFHRPLLAVSRQALRDLLTARGQGWIDDPTNDDTRHDRARMRQALAALDLPVGRIAASVENLAATRRDLGAELVERLTGQVWSDGPDLAFAHDHWAAMSPEFRRRALSAALRTISGADHAPRGPAMMRLVERDWPAEPGPATLHGCTVTLDAGVLRIGREAAAAPPPVPSRQAWGGLWWFDGAHRGDTTVAALGEAGVAALDDGWKQGGIPRRSMLAAPGVFRAGRLVFCPFAPLADPARAEAWLWGPRDLVPAFTAAALSH